MRNLRSRAHYALAALAKEMVLSRRLKLGGELRDMFECVDRERWAALEEAAVFGGVEEASPLRVEIDAFGGLLRRAVNEPSDKRRLKLIDEIQEILFAVERKRLDAVARKDGLDPWKSEELERAVLAHTSEEESADAFDPMFGGQGWD